MDAIEKQRLYCKRYREKVKQDPVKNAYYKEKAHQRYLAFKSDENAYREMAERRKAVCRERYRNDEEYRKRLRQYARERYRRLHPECKKTVVEDREETPTTKFSLINDIDRTIFLVKSQIKSMYTTVDVIEILLSIRESAKNIRL